MGGWVSVKKWKGHCTNITFPRTAVLSNSKASHNKNQGFSATGVRTAQRQQCWIFYLFNSWTALILRFSVEYSLTYGICIFLLELLGLRCTPFGKLESGNWKTMELSEYGAEQNFGTLFKDVKYYVVGNIPPSVSDYWLKFCEVGDYNQTCHLTRTRRVRPTFESQTRLTRAVAQN